MSLTLKEIRSIFLEICKINDSSYILKNTAGSILFSKEKWEDLYYSVPLPQGHFHRLLQDNICSTKQERILLRQMLEADSDNVLETLQEQIQNMSID